MDRDKKVLHHGKYEQTRTVINTIEQEIAHFQNRLDMLAGANLQGQNELVTTYKEMIRVRKEIKENLQATLK